MEFLVEGLGDTTRSKKMDAQCHEWPLQRRWAGAVDATMHVLMMEHVLSLTLSGFVCAVHKYTGSIAVRKYSAI